MFIPIEFAKIGMLYFFNRYNYNSTLFKGWRYLAICCPQLYWGSLKLNPFMVLFDHESGRAAKYL